MKLQSDHLDNLDQSYYEHAKDALQISGGMFLTGFKMLVHAVYPDLFTTSASDYVENLSSHINNKKEVNTKKDEENL